MLPSGPGVGVPKIAPVVDAVSSAVRGTVKRASRGCREAVASSAVLLVAAFARSSVVSVILLGSGAISTLSLKCGTGRSGAALWFDAA